MMTYVRIFALSLDESGNSITTTNPPDGAYVYDAFTYNLVLTSNSGTDHHDSYDANNEGEDDEERDKYAQR